MARFVTCAFCGGDGYVSVVSNSMAQLFVDGECTQGVAKRKKAFPAKAGGFEQLRCALCYGKCKVLAHMNTAFLLVKSAARDDISFYEDIDCLRKELKHGNG